MIPSDHFVRYYNEVFKTLEEHGHDHLVAYWRELGRVQTQELGEGFRKGGIQACYEYWNVIRKEENCEAELTLTNEYFEFCMHKCPSLSKVLDNDASASPWYCDHCMGWVEPVMKHAGLHAVMDMQSRTEPHCRSRIYSDKARAEEFAVEARLLSLPYEAAKQS